MRPLKPTTITNTRTTIDIGQNAGAVVIYNDSPFTIDVGFGPGTMTFPAWFGDVVPVGDYMGNWNGQLSLTPTQYSTAVGAPNSVVLGNIYAPGEPVRGTFPVSLVRQTNVGNASLPVTSTTNLINDGNAAGTQIIEATPSGGASSYVDIRNDGRLVIQGLSLSVLTNFLSFTNVGAGTAVLQLGSSLVGIDDLAIRIFNRLLLYSNRGLAFDETGGGIWGTLKGVKVYTGTGNTTTAHGVGVAPAAVVANPIDTHSPCQVFFDATNIVIDIGAVGSRTWCAIAVWT